MHVMGRLIVSEFISLDGVIEAPGGEQSLGERSGWSLPYFNDETAQFKLTDLRESDALLMGRVTYQIHAAAWPSETGEFADRMNGLPKYVVSSTLDTVDWHNARLIRGNIPDEVGKLKQATPRTILIDGGSDLANLLMRHGLIDEYRLLVYPVVVGTGKRLFQDGGPMQALKLIAARTFATGVMALTYQPAETPGK
jgi:dihydrofolate reductase